MAHAWKACWVQALGGSNPPSSATGPRDRFRFRGFCCLQPRLISGRREACPPASRPRRELRSARRLEARPGPAGLAAASNRAGLVAVNGQAPPPPTGTAVRPSGPSGALHTGGTCGAVCPGRQSGGPALPSPGLVPLDSEALDDLCARERGQDLARHEQFRAAKARADAAPSDRARRVDEEPP